MGAECGLIGDYFGWSIVFEILYFRPINHALIRTNPPDVRRTNPSPATAQQPPSRCQTGRYGEPDGRSLRLGRTGPADPHPLLYERSLHQVQPDLFAEDALGEGEGGADVLVDDPMIREVSRGSVLIQNVIMSMNER